MHLVAIVGRPNVGKSALFNRLAGSRIAIVEDEPGVTRDRIYTDIEWQGRRFTLIDTGGLEPGVHSGFAPSVARQVEVAVSEADLLLMLVDARAGLTPVDEEIAAILRRSGKKVLLVVNKVDSPDLQALIYPFYRLGFGTPLPVSAEHGLGTGDLLDAIVELLPPATMTYEDDDRIHVAILGRPNVGKSSLVNGILGDERVIVSDVPGTTRDAVDIPWECDAGKFVFIDTAGLRRRARIDTAVEYYSVVRARRALQRADVGLIVFDGSQRLAEQDKRIAGLAAEAGKAMILIVNKWDLVLASAGQSPEEIRCHWEEQVRHALPNLQFAPLITVSALSGRGVQRIPRLIKDVYTAYTSHLPTAQLNRVVQDAVDRHQPPSIKGRSLKIHYVTQVRSGPPTFIVFVNDPALVTSQYRRYLENRIRDEFPLTGTPIRFVLRNS